MSVFFLKDERCYPPDHFSELFSSAWKAIECGNVKKFSSTLDGMVSVFEKDPSNTDLDDRFIDVCIISSVVSRHTRTGCVYLMSLLAYAAIHNQRAMVDILIARNASTWITGEYNGSPLTLMLTYALHHGCPEMIDEKMITVLIKGIPKDKLWKETDGTKVSNFDDNIVYHIPDKSNETGEACSPVELAIQLQRMDIAKQFVQAGANPICAIDTVEQILPLLLEFFEFGTNHYISWLLHEHLHPYEISGFIEKVLEKEPMIFSKYAEGEFKDGAGRHHVHGLLTCGHKEMIKRFITRFPKRGDIKDMLRVQDCADRTALQIAASNGDLESVDTLLSMYTEWVNRPDDGIDIAKALLAAAKANHVKIVDIILRKDNQDDSIMSVLHVEINGLYTWKIAVLEELSCIFETLRHYDQSITAESFDDEGNTLGHITAKSGNVNLFKVVFPLERKLPSDMVKESLQQKHQYSMFWALVLENSNSDTPLMVAIDNNHYSIIESLQDRAVERELRQNAKQNKEKTEWEHFWNDCGCKLLIHACSSGSSRSLESVKALINITKSTVGYLPERWTVEAFKGSIKAGNDDVVNYFLHNFQTFIDQSLKNKSLLEAADSGHHRCVRVLLKNGADIKTTDKADKNNCLMKAIEKNHRETVLTILSDGTFGPESLRFVRERPTWYARKLVKKVEYTQPFILLIKHMPDIAEWVLNKCALSKPSSSDSQTDSEVVVDLSRQQSDVEETDLGGGIQHQKSEVEETDLGGGFQHQTSAEEVITQKETDYIMDDKFEILEQPDECTCQSDNNNQRDTSRWVQTVKNIAHPIQTMVDHDRTDMLNHNMVQTWINHRLKDVIPDLIIYMLLYLLFLANLTTFTFLLPRPGPWNDYCHTNQSSLGSITLNTSAKHASTDSEGYLDSFSKICNGQSGSLVIFFYFDAVVLILASMAYLILEFAQLVSRIDRYLKEIENYIQVVMFVSVIIFAFPIGQNSCWCLPGWKWQIGALAVFLAWINLLLLIRYIPWLKVGEHSTMLFNVYINFAKLIYLPILLLVTFAIPLYMLLVDSAQIEGSDAPSALAIFTSPFTTFHKVVFQTAGEIDANDILYNTSHHYEVTSFALFLIFVIAMPILFNNFLIGMAVGETQVERDKAYLSLTKRKIYYIFEVQNVLYRKVIPYFTRKCCRRAITREITLKANDEHFREFRAKDKAIKDDIKSKTRAKYTKRNVKRLKTLLTQNHSTLTLHKVELEKSLQSLGEEVVEMKNEMAEIKESVKEISEIKDSLSAMKAMIAKHFE